MTMYLVLSFHLGKLLRCRPLDVKVCKASEGGFRGNQLGSQPVKLFDLMVNFRGSLLVKVSFEKERAVR